MSPDFLPPARCDFSHARKGKWPLCRGFFFEKAVFLFSRGKNRISQGVENRGSLISVPLVRVVKTVLLANGHFAGVTPAIFVIFVDFRGLSSKIPCFCGQNALPEFSPIFVKTTCFRQGTKRPFSKTTVSTTLIWPSGRKKENPFFFFLAREKM